MIVSRQDGIARVNDRKSLEKTKVIQVYELKKVVHTQVLNRIMVSQDTRVIDSLLSYTDFPPLSLSSCLLTLDGLLALGCWPDQESLLRCLCRRREQESFHRDSQKEKCPE